MNEKKKAKLVETLAGRVKRLKGKLKDAKDAVAARRTRKKLKRAQRRRRVVVPPPPPKKA